MRKRNQNSQIVADSSRRRAWFDLHGRYERAAGRLDYSYLPERPHSNPAVFLLRKAPTFYDALCLWRVQGPEVPCPAELKGTTEAAIVREYATEAWAEYVRAWEAETSARYTLIELRQDAATPDMSAEADRSLAGASESWGKAKEALDTLSARFVCKPKEVLAWESAIISSAITTRLIKALGEARTDYGACSDAVVDYSDGLTEKLGLTAFRLDNPDPRVRAIAEIRWWVHPLMLAYADPKRFFAEIAPQRDQNQLFDPKEIGPFEDGLKTGKLGQTLFEWGYGALLNPSVRAAFDGASPEALARILAEADRREAYVEGRPKGAKSKLSRSDREMVRRVATKKTPMKVRRRLGETLRARGIPVDETNVQATAVKMASSWKRLEAPDLEKLMNEARPTVEVVVRRSGLSREDKKDAISDALMRIHRFPPIHTDPPARRAFFRAVARSVVVDRLRLTGRECPLPENI